MSTPRKDGQISIDGLREMNDPTGKKNEYITAVIVAAGLSSRMGAFKPLLPLGTMSMARRCADHLRKAGADEIIMITGHQAAALEAHLADMKLRFVHNPDYAQSDMFRSARLGLSAVSEETTRILLTPVDIPAVRPETVRLLLRQTGEIVRPVFRGEAGHPILIDRSIVPAILSYGGTMGLRGAIERCGAAVRDIDVSDDRILLDADTPADYQRLLSCFED